MQYVASCNWHSGGKTKQRVDARDEHRANFSPYSFVEKRTGGTFFPLLPKRVKKKSFMDTEARVFSQYR